ncbi:MAG: M20 family metallo-hydrolase [Chitinophagaceae bacterium]|jgi:acetylornithine deacetylase
MTSITTLSDEAVGLLKLLIACPSVSKQEQGSAGIIESFFFERGIQAKRHLNNVWAVNKHYDANKKTILLNSHHDTVKPNSSYTLNPFDPIMKEGKLYGLGSNDAGGCLVSLALTFIHFYHHQGLKYNLLFAATAEEEISGENGMEAVLTLIDNIDCAIVGEPTLMDAAIAEKGLMVLDCMTLGVSGHAAREEGQNAIYKAIKDIAWIKNFKFPKVSELLGSVKMSVTQIEAGSQHNVVPDCCRFTIDVRVNEHYTLEEILTIIKQNINCEVIPRSLRLRSSNIPKEHPLVKAALKSGSNYFGSATLSDKALMPFPALKIGPGDSARSHTADEFIYTVEIENGIRAYIEILNQLL